MKQGTPPSPSPQPHFLPHQHQLPEHQEPTSRPTHPTHPGAGQEDGRSSPYGGPSCVPSPGRAAPEPSGRPLSPSARASPPAQPVFRRGAHPLGLQPHRLRAPAPQCWAPTLRAGPTALPATLSPGGPHRLIRPQVPGAQQSQGVPGGLAPQRPPRADPSQNIPTSHFSLEEGPLVPQGL